MGDPRKLRRKYSQPTHPWKRARIAEEKEVWKKYGLKNRKEIWKAKSEIRKIREQARKLLAIASEKAEKEKNELLSKLRNLGVEVKNLDDILALKVENLLDRRLQTMVYKKGIANTVNQARQFVIHGHILVGGRVINAPGYFIKKDEEDKISLKEKTKFKIESRQKQKTTTKEERKEAEGRAEKEEREKE